MQLTACELHALPSQGTYIAKALRTPIGEILSSPLHVLSLMGTVNTGFVNVTVNGETFDFLVGTILEYQPPSIDVINVATLCFLLGAL